MSFRFELPLFLLLLLIIPLLILIRAQMGHAPGIRYADTRLIGQSQSSWRMRLRPLLATMRYLAIALVVLAIARPQSGQSQDIIRGEGVDIVMALDISGSMASLDFQPDNRLTAAKQVISDFIKERPYDRIGLVVFAANAFNQSPLTVDHTVLERLLDQVELATDLKLDDGTAIGLGLANAANMLKDSPSKSKVVILLTDGVNNSGQIDPLTAAEAANALGIKVYTIGAGRPGSVPVPIQDAFGRQQVVMQQSVLDETTLKNIAEKTGGLFFRAQDTEGLQQVYDQINQLEVSPVEIHSFSRFQELEGGLLIVALALLLGEKVLSHTLLRTIP